MKTRILSLVVLLIFIGSACKPKEPKSEIQPQVSALADSQKIITAKVFIKPGREADFISAAQVMITNSNKEEGCTGYMLYQDPYERTNFIFIETYKNQAAIDAHFATPNFKEFGPKIADMTSKPGEIKILDIAGKR